MPRSLAPLVVLTLALLAILDAAPAQAADVPVENGDFASWKDGLPTGWSVGVGARRAAERPKASVIERRTQGGVALAGDASTTTWRLLTQTIQTPPGGYVELRYRARALGLERADGQFGSCYVGFIFRDDDGSPMRFQVNDIRHAYWQEGAVRFAMPGSMTQLDVAIFLSQTGRLEVEQVSVRTRGAEDSFDILVDEMDRHYSYFHLHGIDWQALTARHRAAAEAAKTPTAFMEAILPMLAALKDGHVWIKGPRGRRIDTWTPEIRPNFDVQVLVRRLTDVKQVARNVLSGRTPEGFGYLAIGTLQLSGADYAKVEAALLDHFDRPGLILDLRVNGGGAETWAQRLCSLLTPTRVHYASQLMRSGRAHGDLAPAGTRHLDPAQPVRYEGHVVALIGPGCVSSGEGMAMMLKAIPDVPLVGLPTRGSSGNPQPAALPNGVLVWYSTWVSLLPDGTPIERKGVPPDVVVEHVPGEDRTLDEAVKILKAKAGKR